MKHELNLAITLLEQPLIFAVPVAIVVLALAIVVLRKRSNQKRTLAAWEEASQQLGISIDLKESKLGPTARGTVNNHMVAIAPDPGKEKKGSVSTQYGVAYDAPEAPEFHLTKRNEDSPPIVDTGNPKFDAAVAVRTADVELLQAYLTAPRRAAILRLLTYWPNAEISNQEAYIRSVDIEDDHQKLVDSICHLVASAEMFDRPSPVPEMAMAEGDVLTEVRLDEITVLSDLFDSELSEEEIAARFDQVYAGRDVDWVGEVLRIGSFDDVGRQRVAVLIGSADGQDPASGRVVAITAVKSDPYLAEGKVLNIAGTLANLDPAKRLFHLA